ncbi:MAG: hexokinase [Phycisphaerae bacterium]|nr:hexokinase [Phycisphaerae bacterium]
MNPIRKTVIDFLRSQQMDVQDVDFQANLDIFSKEMQRGLAGQDSSLEMIPTFLSAGNDVPTGKRVIVADAGGTNFRVATVYFDENKKPVIENLKKDVMPGVERSLTRQEFFEAAASYFRHVASLSKEVGFCFSYPTQKLPSKDGRLIRFAKEIKADEVIGELIGENLAAAMASMNMQKPEKIIILNDTVATLLAGVGYQNRSFDGYIGFILGTGTNTSYLESHRNITKQGGLPCEGNMIINVESGGMGMAHRGKLDKAFDESTNNPGVHAFEKMISGAYLGPLTLLTMKKAADDGLLSSKTANAIRGLSDLDTKTLNDFMSYPYGDNPLAAACANREPMDVELLYVIANRLVERAAKLTAVNLSAMAVKTGCGTNPARPICIVADGTTFYRMKTLKSRVEFYLKKHLEDQRGIYTEIIHVENAPIIGAAIAGLTN